MLLDIVLGLLSLVAIGLVFIGAVYVGEDISDMFGRKR